MKPIIVDVGRKVSILGTIALLLMSFLTYYVILCRNHDNENATHVIRYLLVCLCGLLVLCSIAIPFVTPIIIVVERESDQLLIIRGLGRIRSSHWVPLSNVKVTMKQYGGRVAVTLRLPHQFVNVGLRNSNDPLICWLRDRK